jgi:hypothetical protein
MRLRSKKTLPFTKKSKVFALFQQLWEEELGEQLTYEKAEEYGPKVLALVGSVARSKRLGLL